MYVTPTCYNDNACLRLRDKLNGPWRLQCCQGLLRVGHLLLAAAAAAVNIKPHLPAGKGRRQAAVVIRQGSNMPQHCDLARKQSKERQSHPAPFILQETKGQ
jgi:hypothetical protein